MKRRSVWANSVWANYNGPGKPITEEQLEELLATAGIKPRVAVDGTKYWHRDDFVEAWKAHGVIGAT